LTTLQVKGKAEGRVRAGAFALSLLSVPLNVHVLQALEAEPRSLTNLCRAVGSPPQTTLRKHLQTLHRLGVISKQRGPKFPGTVDYELADPGRDLLQVAAILQNWLSACADGPLTLGALGSKGTIKALVEGWSSTLIRAFAGRALSLTELDALISGLSYPSLERRLASMRMAGLVRRCQGRGRGTPYVVTDWLRLAVAPLAAAVRWERRHVPAEATPVGRLDIETGFLLSVPLVQLPSGQSGVCRLAVETSNGGERRLAGVLVGIEEGSVAYCRARLEGNATAWASGPTAVWLRAVLEHDTDALEVGGDCDLAYEIVGRLNGVLAAAQKDGGEPAGA
jgi:DNA-binding HxlR family transcriptional regulator